MFTSILQAVSLLFLDLSAAGKQCIAIEMRFYAIERKVFFLTLKIHKKTEHCFAIKDTSLGKFRNYEIEAEMLSLESNDGQNSGYLGIIFNYQDQLNYDFVYLEYVYL